MKQYNLFGELVELKETPKPTRKFKTMQELHGYKDNETCKTCSHLMKFQYNKTYYKCELWMISNSAATDIRLKNKACSKWEK